MINKKGDMGIGTLILFIAFILVAAVAASVLVSTTGALQSKALATGKATQTEVGTSMSAIEVYAEDASDDGVDKEVDFFYFTIKLASGSDPVRFSDVLITMNTANMSRDYKYSSDVGVANCTNQSWLNSSGNSELYGIGYALKSSQYTSGYIFPGDVVKLCFKSPRSIGEVEDIKINLIPKVGATLTVDVVMPALMKDKRIYVFP